MEVYKDGENKRFGSVLKEEAGSFEKNRGIYDIIRVNRGVLLSVLPALWRIRGKGGLDQPTQRTAGLFSEAVL